MKEKKLVYGVGVDDSGYVTLKRSSHQENGKQVESVDWFCPYFNRWRNRIKACYSSSRLKIRPTYWDCTMSDSWLTFSNFRMWMVEEEKRLGNLDGLHLDKDFLSEGPRKVYSVTTCVFIQPIVNQFITDRSACRGVLPIGVQLPKKSSKKYKAECSNPFMKGTKGRYIGYFSCPLEAHYAWQIRKHELAIQLANSEYVTDDRVRDKLLTRYAPDTDWLEGWSLEDYNNSQLNKEL